MLCECWVLTLFWSGWIPNRVRKVRCIIPERKLGQNSPHCLPPAIYQFLSTLEWQPLNDTFRSLSPECGWAQIPRVRSQELPVLLQRLHFCCGFFKSDRSCSLFRSRNHYNTGHQNEPLCYVYLFVCVCVCQEQVENLAYFCVAKELDNGHWAHKVPV